MYKKGKTQRGWRVIGMSYVVEVKKLSKSFKKKQIINEISFTIEEGSIVGLLGPNGSGKTTIIRLLNGVINATAGEIRVLGYDPQKDGKEIRKNAGIVTESTSLYHEMTAWENLMFFAELYEVKGIERIEYLLKEFGMWEHRDELVGSFSTGMKKRISLAKALLHQPKILFLDEPTNGLDPEGIQFVLHLLKKINEEENITIIICSHVLQQLETICDSFVFIKNGHVLESGKRRELERKYITQVAVEIETGLIPKEEMFKGYSYERTGEETLVFFLQDKHDISALLTEILQESWVHHCQITNNSLDNLYFAVGGERHE